MGGSGFGIEIVDAHAQNGGRPCATCILWRRWASGAPCTGLDREEVPDSSSSALEITISEDEWKGNVACLPPSANREIF